MKLTPEDIRRLAKMTLATCPSGIDCEDWIHAVGEYVELHNSGQPLSDRMRAVAKHAELCPHCADELEVLKELSKLDNAD